ncbi:hypothetical protein [Bacillus mesophilum]|uniref:Asp23/Gls24 family envelope stress response protein n=1 Tax=Bacillus mesophilum TaxID=1071718 RepID=A0A7V7RPP5_9BACI|nr:hypothetical protein [Bacillus mesophilum]KAB2335288.1 hypothetical protein F7732_01595 [Bacillus mesophilum]
MLKKRNPVAEGIINTIVEANIDDFEHIEMYKRMQFTNIFPSPIGEALNISYPDNEKVKIKINVTVVDTPSVIQKLPVLQEKIAEEIREFTGVNVEKIDIAIKRYIHGKKQ